MDVKRKLQPYSAITESAIGYNPRPSPRQTLEFLFVTFATFIRQQRLAAIDMIECKMPALLILWLVCSSIHIKTKAESSGNGNITLPTLYPNESCSVPIYSQPAYEVHATDNNFQLLLTEGKCFLSCLQYYYHNDVRMKIVASVKCLDHFEDISSSKYCNFSTLGQITLPLYRRGWQLSEVIFYNSNHFHSIMRVKRFFF